MTSCKKDKELHFHSAIRWMLHSLNLEMKRCVADLLDDISKGTLLSMPASKLMPIVGKGVHELRIKDKSGHYRIFYYTKHFEKILVFHMFKKTTRKTPHKEIKLAKKRLKEML